MRTRTMILGLVCWFWVSAIPTQAQIPGTMSYQGSLKTFDGTPITDPVTLQFALYENSSGGTALWTESHEDVTVTNGIYSVMLGSRNPLALTFDRVYYLQVSVAGAALTPRQPLSSVPYALAVKGLAVNEGYVGLGTAAPIRELHVQARAGEEDVYIGLTRGDGAFAEIGYDQQDAGLNIRMQGQTRVFMGENGQVGIGTTQPQAALDVQGYVRLSSYLDLAGSSKLIRGRSDTSGLGIYANTDAWNSRNWVALHGSGDAARTGELELAGAYLNFRSGVTTTGYGKTGMTLAANGNLGIGTTTPGRQLHVAASPGVSDVYLRLTNGAGHDADIGYDGDSDGIEFRIQGAPRMFIGDSGNVGIGTVSPAYRLDVNGIIRATNVSVSSDRRWKTDIAPLEHPLERLMQVRGVSYRWIDPARGDGPQIGVIAQEVEPVFPEVVVTDPEGYKSVDYAKLVAPLIEAVKELNARNDALAAEIEALKAQNAAFERRLQALEAAK